MSRFAFPSAVVAVLEHIVARRIQRPEGAFTWTIPKNGVIFENMNQNKIGAFDRIN